MRAKDCQDFKDFFKSSEIFKDVSRFCKILRIRKLLEIFKEFVERVFGNLYRSLVGDLGFLELFEAFSG